MVSTKGLKLIMTMVVVTGFVFLATWVVAADRPAIPSFTNMPQANYFGNGGGDNHQGGGNHGGGQYGGDDHYGGGQYGGGGDHNNGWNDGTHHPRLPDSDPYGRHYGDDDRYRWTHNGRNWWCNDGKHWWMHDGSNWWWNDGKRWWWDDGKRWWWNDGKKWRQFGNTHH